jgi:hypothetical protein
MAISTITPKLPHSLLVRMADYACRLAVAHAPKRTGLGAKGLTPVVKDGSFGINIADWAYYMSYQNYGFGPFIMWSLEGKTIPMSIGGKTVFRVAKGVGGRQIQKRDPKTGQVLPGNKPIKWRHPGLKGKFFIQEAGKETIAHFMPEIIYHITKGILETNTKEIEQNG